jgi:eukaryotic-like serine/threonine-protein kinase
MTTRSRIQPSEIDIPGIQLLEELGRGAFSVVYRASRGNQMFAVKVQKPQTSSEEARLRFRREAAALARIRHPGLATIQDVGEANGSAYLVREHVEGRTLASVIREGPLAEELVVAVAKQLAGALAEVHRRGFVHRDVKPENILLDKSNAPMLIDFGFAMSVSGDRDAEDVVGTVLYSAPEQTGMLHRPVDARADLYALGVVLLESTTGSNPFSSSDVSEVMQRHAALPPPNARQLNPAISSGFAAIIAKLLAKDPDDRYQTACGLLADLDNLPNLNASLSLATPAPLGSADDLLSAAGDAPLVGRDAELAELLDCLAQVRRGRGALVFLEGEPGCGKSRLVREFLQRTRLVGPLFLTGKCLAADPRPFGPLRQAFDDYVHRLGRTSPLQRQLSEERVRKAAADAAPLLRHFSISLASLLEDAPDGGGENREQEQFFNAIADFVVRLAEAHAQGVLFIDDVQWLDGASRQVLRRLAARLADVPLLVIAAARRTAESAEALEAFARDMGAALVHRMSLGLLDAPAIARLVAAHLADEHVDPTLARHIHARSGGNPFAAEEYLRAMLDAGVVRPCWGTWRIDAGGIDRLALPANVLELVLKRVVELDEPTRAILIPAAVIGCRFRLDLLGEICRVAPGDVYRAITEATRVRMVERGELGEYGFVHDRVQEALLVGLEASRARDLHQRIAEALDASGGSGPNTFALGRHYAQGHTERNPRRVYESNLAAGQAALENFANEEALGFLEEARRAAAAGKLETEAALDEALGTACARMGRTAPAVAHLERCLARSSERLQRARIRHKLSQVHMAGLETTRARDEIEKALLELERLPPRTDVPQILRTLWDWATFGLGSSGAAIDAQQREHALLFSQLYADAGVIYHFDLAPPILMLQAGVRGIKAAAPLGPSPQLAFCLGLYSVLQSRIRRRPEPSDRFAAMALQMAKQIGDRTSVAKVSVYRAYAKHFQGRPCEAKEMMQHCLEKHGRWLDPLDYLNGSSDLTWNLMMRGHVAEAWIWAEQGIRKADQAMGESDFVHGHTIRCYAGPVLAILGRASEGAEHLARYRALIEKTPGYRWRWAQYLANRALYLLEKGELGTAFEEAVAENRKLRLRPNVVPMHLRHFWAAQAYARLEQCCSASPADRPATLEPLALALDELSQAAGRHPTLGCHHLVVRAAWQGLAGRNTAAFKLFNQAEQLARAIDSPWCRYEVARHRARLLARGSESVAAVHEARFAQSLAAESGWPDRARRIQTEFGLDGVTMAARVPELSTRSSSSGTRSLRIQRHLDALLQVSLASAKVFDPDQHARVALDEIVGILGAERAFLFRCEEGSQVPILAAARDAARHDFAESRGYSRRVVELVLSTRKPLVVTGTEEGAALGSQSIVAQNLRSIIAAPLLFHDRLVGAVYLDSRLAKGMFTGDDLQILLAIANHIAIAMENARAALVELQLEAERRQRELAERLRSVSSAMNSTLKREEVLDRLLESLAAVVPCDSAAVLLVEGTTLAVKAARGFSDQTRLHSLRRPIADDDLFAELARTRQPVIGDDARWIASLGTDGAAARAWMGVPLLAGDQVIGLLALHSHKVLAYGLRDADIAFTFAGQAVTALENARLFGEVERLAITDDLTGLFNRRHFFWLADRAFRQARRYERPLCAVMVDIDHFKQVNDLHGHAAGDLVLRTIAVRLRETLREVDVVGRYGGEELAILLVETPLAGGLNACERLRKAVAEPAIATEQGPLEVTASLGIAEASAETATVASLLERADGAMYVAKRAGRNRVRSG